jgi:hypothetical protein
MSRSDTESSNRVVNPENQSAAASPRSINKATTVMVIVLALIVIVGILILSGIYTAGPR